MNVRRAPVQEGRERAGVIEERLARPNGAFDDAETLRMPKSYEGKPAGLGVGSEKTEHKWPEEVCRQRDFYEALLAAQSDVGEGLLVIEGERIRYANKAFCLTSGYSAEELTALSSYSDLAAEDQRPLLDDWMRRRKREGAVVEDRCETAILHRSGRRVELEVGVRPLLREGQLPHLIAVVHDITARKQVEERLQISLGMLVAVHEASRVLGSSLDPRDIGKRLVEVMRRVSDLDAAILRARDERGRLSVMHAHGPQDLLQVASTATEAQVARLKALETGEFRRPFHLARPKESGMPVVVLCLPLVIRKRVVGLLEAYGPETLANKMAVETLQSLAGQAASMLENAQLYREMAERERRLKGLVGKLLEAKEEERRRVAYEVHDGLTQVAVAAYQHLQAFAKGYLPDSASSQTKLEGTLELARETVREARSVIADLRPRELEDFGLVAALRSKVAALRADGWQISYDEALGDERLPDEIETALYRVTQEALANVRKHAQTAHARITLARGQKGAYLEVRDWGRGFEQSAVPKVGRWGEQVGIQGMRERIAWLGGELTVCSQPGVGTRVVAEIPLPTSEGANVGRAR